MINISQGVYLYIYKECLLVVIGSDIICDQSIEKICKYIQQYIHITSNTCPTVVWCTINSYMKTFNYIINKGISNVGKNVFHDVFIIGKVDDIKDQRIRDITNVSLQEERVSKSKSIVLRGYGFSLDETTLFEYLLTIMNRISNY